MGEEHAPIHPLVAEVMLDRRTILGALAAAGAGLAVGCGSDDPVAAPTTTTSGSPPSTAAPTTSAAPTTTAPEPTGPWWTQGGFAPVPDEVEAVDLPVEGALPPELDGLYVRNGSNPIDRPSGHWFVGDGMVHGVRLEGGRASWFANRYVQTPYRTGAGDDAGIPGEEVTEANVSVFEHGGRLWTSGEVGWPYRLGPDLGTEGAESFDGALHANFTAHPKRDPTTGLLHAFGYGFFEPHLTYSVISADGTQLLHTTPIEIGGPVMMHDFAITDQEAIFWEMPVVFALDAMERWGIPYTWDPGYRARLGVLPLGADGGQIRWVDIDDGFVFHGTNAWRDGDRIHVDVGRINAMFADDIDPGPSRLTRWTVVDGGRELSWTTEPLSDLPIDFPMIDRRFQGRAHTRAWYIESTGSLDDGFEFTGIVDYDVARGDTAAWRPAPALQPSEAFFVAAGDDAAEGEGWLLSYVYDRAADSSLLAVLDATDVAAGPVATVTLPQRVPFGFHGTWLAGP